jgi:hypothetical protein
MMRSNLRRLIACAFAFLCAAIVLSGTASAQTYTVLHQFTGEADGGGPLTGLTIDAAGRLYGTTSVGGAGNGTVFQLKRAGSGWTFAPLYSFLGGNDGALPDGRVVFGPNGTLYGTTLQGGGATYCIGGCGTVFNLHAPARACSRALCPWMEEVLYAFQGGNTDDGLDPLGDLIFDASGNLFGVTDGGGVNFAGTVYELTPSGGSWSENVLHNFVFGPNDGQTPQAGVVLEGASTLYGTTTGGGHYSGGTVFELGRSGSGWIESLIHSFHPVTDGNTPIGISMDSAGNLYGGTLFGGPDTFGTVWQLSQSGGSWTFNVISPDPGDTCGVAGPVTLDSAGNVYGATCDTIFELSPSGGGWTHTVLYRFSGGPDGGQANGNLVLDANGNIYGTTYNGGGGNCSGGCGVVYEIER